MRVLITGISGLVGSNLAAAAAARGWDVTGTWRSTPVTIERAASVALDFADPGAFEELAAALRPDAIIHAAASVELARLERDPDLAALNSSAVSESLRAAAAARAHYCLVSSDWVFSGELDRSDCWSEDAPTGPVNAYGRSKLASERAVQAFDRPWLITRPANVYGVNLSVPTDGTGAEDHVWSRSSLALRWVARLRAGQTIPAPRTIHQSATFAWDYAERVCALVAQQATGVWNLAGPRALDRHAYLDHLARSFDCNPDLITEGSVDEFLRACGDDPQLPLPVNTALCDDKARARLGPAVDVDVGHRLMREQLNRTLSGARRSITEVN